MKVLIANRGEIACRIAHSVESCAGIYEAGDDHHRVFVREMVEVPSYLDGAAIIGAAQALNCAAIHPGYGFLSENPDFAQSVLDAGLIWIGPDPESIRAMGLKDNAKSLMEAAGVPVVPGYHGAEQDPSYLASQADAIGYPVLIKARAGGGGKGMRKVDRAEDFIDALASAKREALAGFGDDRVLIEKFVENPRHIEVQVLGDRHGNLVHLFERDCSMQRRHQKVIEEAPAPGISEDFRQAICSAAVDAARAVNYVSAGTVEFIVPGDLSAFYFMEMNTRLQVEHPVTEAITGVDLVCGQVAIAAGEPLSFSQDDLAIDGHAIEARIYAENPSNGFLPETGRILDSADAFGLGDFTARGLHHCLDEGQDITGRYDPMIAKAVHHAETRAEARSGLRSEISEFTLFGITTNRGFLNRLLADEGFAAGKVSTGLIEARGGALTDQPAPSDAVLQAAAHVAVKLHGLTPGYRHWGAPDIQVDIGQRVTLDVDCKPDLDAVKNGADIWVADGAETYKFTIPDPLDREVKVAVGDAVLAPMPGSVTAVDVTVGDAVTEGQRVAVLEAMKMEQALLAPRDGVVCEVSSTVGDQVSGGDLLVRLEARADA